MPTLFINTDASDITTSSVRSVSTLTPISLPQLVLGDTRGWSFFFITGDGEYASFSGDAGYSLKVGIGPSGANATGGTFTITGDGTILSGTTAAIPYSADAAAVLAAITDATTGLLVVSSSLKLASSQVTVSGNAADYIFDFKGSLAGVAIGALSGSGANLTPPSSVTFSVVRGGGSGANARQSARVRQLPYCFQNVWTPITNGWSGTISTNTESLSEYLDNSTNGQLPFEVEVTDGDGNRRTYYQGSVSILNEVINNEALIPAPLPVYYDSTEIDAILSARNYNATFTNTAGDTTLTPAASVKKGLVVGTIAGSARTSAIVLDVTGRTLNDRFTLRLNIPSTADIVLDVANATSGGTSLIGGAITTTGAAGQSLLVDVYFDGTAFQPLSLIYPTL